MIKSIVILINSTENCHRYCHDLRFFCCFGIRVALSFDIFICAFSHIVSVYWDCVCVCVCVLSSIVCFRPIFFKTQCLLLHSTIFHTRTSSRSFSNVYKNERMSVCACVCFCVRGVCGYVYALEHTHTHSSLSGSLFATDIYYEYANYARARVNEAPIKSKIILLALFLFILIQRMSEILKHFIAFVRSFVRLFICSFIHFRLFRIFIRIHIHAHFFFIRDFVVKVIYIFGSCYMIRHRHTYTRFVICVREYKEIRRFNA